MTAVAAPFVRTPSTAPLAAPSARSTRTIPGILVGLAVASLTMPFAEASGGRGPRVLIKAVVVVVAALIAAKPWKELLRVVSVAVLAFAVVAGGIVGRRGAVRLGVLSAAHPVLGADVPGMAGK